MYGLRPLLDDQPQTSSFPPKDPRASPRTKRTLFSHLFRHGLCLQKRRQGCLQRILLHKKIGDEIAKIPRWRYENHLMSMVSYSLIASYIMRGLLARGLSAEDSVDAMIVGLWRMPFTYEGAKRLWKSEFVS